MKKKIFAAAIASVASVAMAQTVNTSLWFDGSDQQVETGGDCKYDYTECPNSTMGYWYDYDDRKNDHGGSYAMYPFDTTGYYGSMIAPEIENLGYVVIQFHLEDPTTTGQTAEYPYNFVGFGFNLVNGTKDPLDITAAGGLCATYTSDMNVTLEIAEATSGDASCNATLKASPTPKTESIEIAGFKQPSWVEAKNKLASCADAFKAAQSVKFKLDGGASAADGKLRIFEVGPAGTCKGGKSVAGTEPSSFSCKADGDGHASCDGPINAIKTAVAAGSVKATLSGRTLSFNGVKDGMFEIVSLQGQVVKSGKVASSISLSSLDAGVYMVRVSGKSVHMSQKILVK